MHLRTGLQLRQERRLCQPELHLLVVHLRAGLLLRHLSELNDSPVAVAGNQ